MLPIRRRGLRLVVGQAWLLRLEDRTLRINEARVITVVGKAFDHAPKDHSNRRTNFPGYAAWEIHPVMKIVFSD